MKSASVGLQAVLASGGPYCLADLYTMTLFGGTFYRWTNADRNLTVGGNTFVSSTAPILQRGTTRIVAGLEVDTLEVSLETAASSAYLLNGLPLPLGALNGFWDGARVQVDRFIGLSWADTGNGVVPIFAGNVAAVDPSSDGVLLHVASDLERLQNTLPRNLYMPGCSHVLFDTGCGLNRATFTSTVTVTAGATATSVPVSATGAANYYQLGVMVGVTGLNVGARRTIATNTGPGAMTLTPAVPWPSVPAVGDTFTVTAGCDKTLATCSSSKFLNQIHFRGFPLIPQVEAAR